MNDMTFVGNMMTDVFVIYIVLKRTPEGGDIHIISMGHELFDYLGRG